MSVQTLSQSLALVLKRQTRTCKEQEVKYGTATSGFHLTGLFLRRLLPLRPGHSRPQRIADARFCRPICSSCHPANTVKT